MAEFYPYPTNAQTFSAVGTAVEIGRKGGEEIVARKAEFANAVRTVFDKAVEYGAGSPIVGTAAPVDPDDYTDEQVFDLMEQFGAALPPEETVAALPPELAPLVTLLLALLRRWLGI